MVQRFWVVPFENHPRKGMLRMFVKSSALFLVLFSCGMSEAQNPKYNQTTSTRWTWVCLERAIPSYTVPEHKLIFSSIGACQVVVPIAEGETLQITPSGLHAAEDVVGVLL